MCGMPEPSFSAVEVAACASPGEKKGEIHVLSSWLSREVFALVTRTAVT